MQNTNNSLRCENCGKQIRLSDSFCSSCGSKVELTKEKTSIRLPTLDKTVGKSKLWNIPKATDSTTEPKASCSAREVSISQKIEQTTKNRRRSRYDKKRNDGWFTSWLTFYRVSPTRSIILSTSVLVQSFMFFPYALLVLYVFQYNWICEILTISSATVLLTHAVSILYSYFSIFEQRENAFVEISRAVEKTQKLLTLGSVLISIFLLAFGVGLWINNASVSYSDSIETYKPATFDD